MGLRRQMMRSGDRNYGGFVGFVTLRRRNSDGTMDDPVTQRWKAVWKPITEETEATDNETVATWRRQWTMFRKRPDQTAPNAGDQIIDRKGDVWEIIGPIEHHLRETVYIVSTIQADMNGKISAQ